MEYYSAIKKDKIMAFAGKWMKLENIMLSEISQSQKNERTNDLSDKRIMTHNVGQEGLVFVLGSGLGLGWGARMEEGRTV